MLATSAEAGGRGRERSSRKEKEVGEETWMKGKHLQHVEHDEEQLERQGHQMKVWEPRKGGSKFILLEIDMTAAVKRTHGFRVA